ncbi:uroplakin-3b [Coturnix japonica]|uniref:uroplakin-3b n=1 Tax=Coturnix japonica TaxID=93934 RepID=UPI0013A5D6EA|nr:uroplakin-3b [Coturnix japonica]
MVTWEGPCPSLPAGSSRAGGASAGIGTEWVGAERTQPWSCCGCCWRWLGWTWLLAWVRGCEGLRVGGGAGDGAKGLCVAGGLPLTAVPPALLPYVPRVAPGAMVGKVTATTFVLERPRCVFDPFSNASDAVWLVVAFADGETCCREGCWAVHLQLLTPHLCHAASTAFKNPTSSSEVPPYEGLPTARAYMTLEMAAATYGCSAPGPAVLRVGADTTCHSRAPCNGPLPSPGPYRVKFLLMGCSGPKAETKWSEPIVLRRARSLSTIDPTPARRGSTTVIIAAILASLAAALTVAMLGAVGYGDFKTIFSLKFGGCCILAVGWAAFCSV